VSLKKKGILIRIIDKEKRSLVRRSHCFRGEISLAFEKEAMIYRQKEEVKD